MIAKLKILFCVGVLFVLCACSAPVNNISQQTLIDAMAGENKPLLIDVRTPDEYAQGHIPGSINIPHDLIQQELSKLGNNKQVNLVLYCRSGMRAKSAQDVLLANNFGQVSHLQGDFPAWQENALPIAKTQPKD